MYAIAIDLATGKVIAVEALLRWHHPEGSVWTAARFVDIAEDTGLILDIGDWVLRRACVHAAAWALARPDRPITVRVNVSALQESKTVALLQWTDGEFVEKAISEEGDYAYSGADFLLPPPLRKGGTVIASGTGTTS